MNTKKSIYILEMTLFADDWNIKIELFQDDRVTTDKIVLFNKPYINTSFFGDFEVIKCFTEKPDTMEVKKSLVEMKKGLKKFLKKELSSWEHVNVEKICRSL